MGTFWQLTGINWGMPPGMPPWMVPSVPAIAWEIAGGDYFPVTVLFGMSNMGADFDAHVQGRRKRGAGGGYPPPKVLGGAAVGPSVAPCLPPYFDIRPPVCPLLIVFLTVDCAVYRSEIQREFKLKLFFAFFKK